MHILPNIWGSKGKQTMKFGQLIECNLRHIFLGKSYTKYVGEISTNFPISKSQYHRFPVLLELRYRCVLVVCCLAPVVQNRRSPTFTPDT